jgi:signal transduction histidine kinase
MKMATKRKGLTGMKERLHAIGGTLMIDSACGQGTKLLMQLPTEISNANSHRAR